MAKTKQDAKAMVEKQPICDLITVNECGSPVERAMFTPKVDDDFTLYFGTYKGSNKCKQIAANPGVVAVWPTGCGYISLSGEACCIDDAATREKAWHPIFGKHFAGGCSDPNFMVVRVSPKKLSYYEIGAAEAETIEL
jgi:general stress protein 26